jgi:hypothetical protein
MLVLGLKACYDTLGSSALIQYRCSCLYGLVLEYEILNQGAHPKPISSSTADHMNLSMKRASSMFARDPFTLHSADVDAVVELERHEPEPEPGMLGTP